MPGSGSAATTTRRRRGRPAKDSGDASALIRAAALREFARAGFAGASLVAIAREAGVAKPLIHYHYASKDALWQAAVSEALEDLRQGVIPLREQLPGAGAGVLRELASRLVRFARNHPELTRIVVDETSKGSARGTWLSEQYLLPGYRLAQALIAGYRAHLPPRAEIAGPEHVIPLVLGAMNFPSLEADVVQAAFGIDVFSDAYADRHADMLYRWLEVLL